MGFPSSRCLVALAVALGVSGVRVVQDNAGDSESFSAGIPGWNYISSFFGGGVADDALAAAREGCLAVAEYKQGGKNWGDVKCRKKMELKDVAKALGPKAKTFPRGFTCRRGYVCGSGDPVPGNNPSVCGRSAGARKTCMPILVGDVKDVKEEVADAVPSKAVKKPVAKPSASAPAVNGPKEIPHIQHTSSEFDFGRDDAEEENDDAAEEDAAEAAELKKEDAEKEPPVSSARAQSAATPDAEPDDEDDYYLQYDLDEAEQDLEAKEAEADEDVTPAEAEMKSSADDACRLIMSKRNGVKCRGTMSMKATKKLLGSKAAPLGDRFTCTRAYVCGGGPVVTGESPSVCGHRPAVRTCVAYDLNPPGFAS